MASLELRSGHYRIVFRFGGRKYHHSLGTTARQEAEALRDRLRANLHDLANGRSVLPPGADLALFLLSDGRVIEKPEVRQVITLGGLSQQYCKAQAATLETDSLSTIAIHLRHIERTLGVDFPMPQLTLADLQRHVDRRRKDRGRRGSVTGYTIRKEITTLGAAWGWAIEGGLLTGTFPSRSLKYPKAGEKPAFQTRADIERQIGRGGLTETEQAELWDSLFLTLPEVDEVLEFIRVNARHDFLYPMACLAAHTGARRSENLRVRINDFDFEAGSVVVREKKRVKGKYTTRRVPLSPFLEAVMREWLEKHPGGPYAFCHATKVWKSKTKRTAPTPITRDEAHDHLRRTLAGGRWSVIRGWHIGLPHEWRALR